MKYRFLNDVATPGPSYVEGEVYDLEQPLADQWVANGWCEAAEPEEAPESNENAVAPKRRGRKPKAQSEDLL